MFQNNYKNSELIRKPNVTSTLEKYTPYFEDEQHEVNITTRIGSTILLDCKIGMLGNKTVISFKRT